MSEIAYPSIALRTLDEIAKDYERSEVTVLWIHERKSGRHILAFAAAEFCPVEQMPSPEFIETKGDGTIHQMVREEIGPERTVYVSRRLSLDPRAALDFYRGGGGVRVLPGDAGVRLEQTGDLSEEPPNETRVVLDAGAETSPYYTMLPHRELSLRVCSRFGPSASLATVLQAKELSKLSQFARRTIGLDLEHMPEHLGAIHLCMANPILRRMHERLTKDERALLIEFDEREGKLVAGCTLELTDVRPAGTGFTLRVQIDATRLILPLPNSPELLRTRLLDPSGECIHESEGTFVRSFVFNLGIGGGRRRIEYRGPDGTVTARKDIDTVSFHESSTPRGHTTAAAPPAALREVKRREEHRRLEEDNSFVFFPGGPESQAHAKDRLEALLGKARVRCLLCDPFLGAGDVAWFAPLVRTQGLEVRLLGSTWFLRQEAEGKNGEPTQADLVSSALAQLRPDPTLLVQVRALRGRDRSPVHDRFLVLDDEVYLLGSSINEFGSRATTLVRVPTADKLIVEAEGWWRTAEPIEDLVKRRRVGRKQRKP